MAKHRLPRVLGVFARALRGGIGWLGIPADSGGHGEKVVSALGGFAGMLALAFTARQFGDPGALLLMGSIGASAVLLFAAPHSPLAQPWPTIGGHVISAVTGVAAAQLVPAPLWAGALAVGGAILAMHYLRCIHPPGGGTALSAAIGGEGVQALGYQYALTPVALDAVAIVLIAVAINGFLAQRRYPVPSDGRRGGREPAAEEGFEPTDSHAEKGRLTGAHIQLGRCYSNGCYGPEWSVRQVVRVIDGVTADRSKVVYRTVAGHGRRSDGLCSKAAFAGWACYEVVRSESHWRKAAWHLATA